MPGRSERCTDARVGQARTKLAAAVQATGTSLTGLFGVGPVVAAAVIGDVRQVSRFGGRDAFAAYNGTAPIEVSSGPRNIYRLSSRAYYDKTLAEAKTGKEAMRALKQQVSDAIFACLQTDARRAAAPLGQPGNDSVASAAGSHPAHRLFAKPLPDPVTTLRPQAATQHPAPPGSTDPISPK